MLIAINDGVASEIDFEDSDCVIAIKNIFLAHREGKHYILFNQKFLDSLKANSEKFPIEINAAIANAASNMLITRACFKQCSAYIELSIGEGVSKWINLASKKLVITVPLKYFLNSEAIQKTEIIPENKLDGEIYKISSDVFCRIEDLPQRVNFRNSGGGGDTTGDNFLEAQISSVNPVLCIVDNDKNCPNSPVGDTARKAERNLLIDRISSVKIIDIHSVESLIPNATYEKILGNDVNKKDALYMHGLIEENFPDLKRYIKLREGVPVPSRIKKVDARKFWEEMEIEINKKMQRAPVECTCGDVCNCLLVPGLGSKLTEKVVRNYKSSGLDVAISDIQSWNVIMKTWLDIGRDVFSWCCAPKELGLH